MRYATIGRSHLDNIATYIENHERVFRAFGVGLPSFFNDSSAKIETGHLVNNSVANYWSRFNIEAILSKNQIDFLILDTWSSVGDDLFFDICGSVFPGDVNILKTDTSALQRDYGWISFEDARFFEALERNMTRFAFFMNTQHPSTRVVIAERLATYNFFETKTATEIKLFTDSCRYGSAYEPTNHFNYRLSLGLYIGRWLHNHIENSALLRSPIAAACRPPSVEAPTHFSYPDYKKLVSELEWVLSLKTYRQHFDPMFNVMAHLFQSHQASQMTAEWNSAQLQLLRKQVADLTNLVQEQHKLLNAALSGQLTTPSSPERTTACNVQNFPTV